MARIRILRPFPAKMPLRPGQIVEDPQWKQLEYLLSRGYVEVIDSPITQAAEIVEPGPEAEELPPKTSKKR